MKRLILFSAILVFLYSSINAQWVALNSGTTNYLNSVHFENANTGWFVGNSSLIRKTINGGNNWVVQNCGLSLAPLECVYFLNPATGWITGGLVGSYTVMTFTNDSGNTWILRDSVGNRDYPSCYFVNTLTGWVAGTNFSSSLGVVRKTTNGGTSWYDQSVPNVPGFRCIHFGANTNIGVAGGVNIVVRTSNGGTSWDTVSHSITANGVYMINASTGYIADNSGNIFRTINGGLNWFQNFYCGFGTLKSVFFYDSLTGWVCGTSGKIMKTSNGGANWYYQSSPVSQMLNSIFFVNSQTGYAVGSGGVLIKTTNGGEIPSNTITIHRYNIFKSLNSSQTMYDTVNFSAYVPGTGYTRYVKISLDTISINNTAELEIDLVHQGITDTMVYHVGGSGSNFYNTILNDSALIPITAGTPPFSNSYRPYKPLNQFINNGCEGLWLLKIYDAAKSPTGVIKSWSITITYNCPPIGINTVNTSIPNDFCLYQNYPNPFNPETKIRFNIIKNSLVTLKVFDLLGREVAVLINDNLKPGYYETPFNIPGNLSSGIYLYSIYIENKLADTKKMVLMK